ncbi:MAG: hypothetical protein C0593_04615 [Marinilabiliales bacterium]|nr:MAG: hypothetical protein C0593_04615 [Marinilabiliales bacterium]
MKDLFYMGGTMFMSILTILLIIMVAWYIFHTVRFFINPDLGKEKALRQLMYGRSIGLFSIITGITGQMVGLFAAFDAIEKAADISPALVFGGVKVSMITTMYGILIFLFGLIIWFIVSQLVERTER